MILLAESPGLFEVVTRIFSRADTLAHPGDLLNTLEQLSIVWACIFLVAGLLCMWHGTKHYKVVTVIMALAIGGFVGFGLGQTVKADYILAACLAALLAVIAWPLMKYAVALMGGLVGAFLGANAWSAIDAMMHTRNGHAPQATGDLYWVGALLGLLVCGMLAFLLFKLSVALFTSVSGATISLLGVLALLLQVPDWREGIMNTMARNAIVLPLLVFVPAIIGLVLQHVQPEKAGGSGGGGSGGGGAAKAAAKPA